MEPVLLAVGLVVAVAVLAWMAKPGKLKGEPVVADSDTVRGAAQEAKPRGVLRELAPGIGLVVFIVLLFTVIGPLTARGLGLSYEAETSRVTVEGTLTFKGSCDPWLDVPNEVEDYQLTLDTQRWVVSGDRSGIEEVGRNTSAPNRVKYAKEGDRVTITGPLTHVINWGTGDVGCPNPYYLRTEAIEVLAPAS